MEWIQLNSRILTPSPDKTRLDLFIKERVRMSLGMILLTVVAILVFFGVDQRVLDKMHLSDKMALLLIALMFFGTLIPNITIGRVSLNLGGTLIPVGICVYLLIKADTNKERIRALIGALVTAGIVYALSALLPDEPEAIVIDPLILYGITGGLVAYLLGRSRRGAFIYGVLGILLADVVQGIVTMVNGVDQTLVLGGAGFFDAMVFSGILGVVLCELLGEALERIVRGKEAPDHERVHNPVKHKEGEH